MRQSDSRVPRPWKSTPGNEARSSEGLISDREIKLVRKNSHWQRPKGIPFVGILGKFNRLANRCGPVARPVVDGTLAGQRHQQQNAFCRRQIGRVGCYCLHDGGKQQQGNANVINTPSHVKRWHHDRRTDVKIR